MTWSSYIRLVRVRTSVGNTSVLPTHVPKRELSGRAPNGLRVARLSLQSRLREHYYSSPTRSTRGEL
jgi:hypothetical protein